MNKKNKYTNLVLIRTEEDYNAALETIESMWDDAKPGSIEEDQLEVLAFLVKQYEKKHYPILMADTKGIQADSPLTTRLLASFTNSTRNAVDEHLAAGRTVRGTVNGEVVEIRPDETEDALAEMFEAEDRAEARLEQAMNDHLDAWELVVEDDYE